jgi:hypothetical protein
MTRSIVSHTIGLTIVALLWASILFPLVMKWFGNVPRGSLVDTERRPLANTTLHFRDSQNHELASVTTDARGNFSLRNLERLAPQVAAPYAYLSFYNNSKGPGRYVFSPTLLQEIVLKTPQGRPVSYLPLRVTTDWHIPRPPKTLRTWEAHADFQGRISLGPQPGPVRFLFQCLDPDYMVQRTRIHKEADSIRYEVTIVPHLTEKGMDETETPLKSSH